MKMQTIHKKMQTMAAQPRAQRTQRVRNSQLATPNLRLSTQSQKRPLSQRTHGVRNFQFSIFNFQFKKRHD
jgi:hypothetical protein